jgi:CheY-like chemotaxis protein
MPVRRRILVVDDNADLAEGMAEVLGASGHDVRIAQDGPAAIATARVFRPQFVFLDIGMPGMDGFQVAEALRREPGLENVRLIAITGYGRASDLSRPTDTIFDYHLIKPVDWSFIDSLLGMNPKP